MQVRLGAICLFSHVRDRIIIASGRFLMNGKRYFMFVRTGITILISLSFTFVMIFISFKCVKIYI